MSLFPGIKVDGHGYKEGLDPNGGSLQSVIEKNIFVETGRGQPFRKKLAAEWKCDSQPNASQIRGRVALPCNSEGRSRWNSSRQPRSRAPYKVLKT